MAETTIDPVRVMAPPPGLLDSVLRLGILAAGLLAFPLPLAAQQDSARSQVRTMVRAFYFNLAHHDWEAIAADVLSAKILASRPPPSTLQAPMEPAEQARCPIASPQVEQAAILLEGDWAAVSVRRCGLTSAGADEFRLIHFEKRWRFISIALFEESMIGSADRW